MSNIDKQIIDEEAKNLGKINLEIPEEKVESEPPAVLSDVIAKHIEAEVIKRVKEQLKDKSGKVELIGQPRVIVDFPEVTKVSGMAKLLQKVDELIGKFPVIQKITGTVKASVDFPETQKIHGTVKAIVQFPDIQKVEYTNKEKEIQKIEGNVKTGLPIVEGAEGKWISGKPGWYIPVRLFNSKRFYDLFESAAKTNGSLGGLVQQLLNKNTASPGLVSGALAVTTSATSIGPGGGVQSVTVEALSTNTVSVFIGPTGVTTSNGYELAPGNSVSLAIDSLAKVFAICASSTPGIRYIGVT